MTSESPAPGNTRANSAKSSRKQTGLSRLNPFRNLPSLLAMHVRRVGVDLTADQIAEAGP